MTPEHAQALLTLVETNVTCPPEASPEQQQVVVRDRLLAMLTAWAPHLKMHQVLDLSAREAQALIPELECPYADVLLSWVALLPKRRVFLSTKWRHGALSFARASVILQAALGPKNGIGPVTRLRTQFPHTPPQSTMSVMLHPIPPVHRRRLSTRKERPQ